MYRTLLCLAAVSFVSCSDQTRLSEQPPAAQLSLAELAAANVQPTLFLNVAGEGTWEDPYIVQGVTAASDLERSNAVKRVSKAFKKR